MPGVKDKKSSSQATEKEYEVKIPIHFYAVYYITAKSKKEALEKANDVGNCEDHTESCPPGATKPIIFER